MKNFTFYLAASVCFFLNTLVAQEATQMGTFEGRAKEIADKIDSITKEEKAALTLEIESVNQQLENGAITMEEADQRKLKLAESRAKSIENRVAVAQDELHQLVNDRVEGRIKDQDSSVYVKFKWFKKSTDNKKTHQGESRTTSQFVFAGGLNNLATNEQVAHSDYKVWGSHFYEWGFTYNTRILKNNNLLHAKYGLSLQYNNLRPTENRFQIENGDQTVLETSAINLEDSRLRNVNLVLPIHLEFDFTKKKFEKDQATFRTHRSFRLGVGGYAGANIKSKQILKFEDGNGNNVRQKTKGDYNVNDFVYGVSAYAGYRQTSLYIKYDLNPVFQDNLVDQNNISMGIRFDFN
ncbi:MAG: hypothetical protein IR153_04425 [Flavobacterium sp.]|nr:hypothetical protein [Flavobacterium sp.]